MTTITLGRSSQNTIIVDGSYNTVSSRHATITENGGALTLQDHSTNGSYVNGQYVHNQSISIRRGDRITLGKQYELSWNDLSRYLGGTHETMRYPQTPHTVRDSGRQEPQVAQQININVGRQASQSSQSSSERETPKCLNSWNWGAFFWGWIWGIGNGVYWPLIMLIPYVGQIASLIIIFILGANGNRYAWDKFTGTAAEFDEKQHSWAVAAGIACIVSILIGIIIAIAIAAGM